MGAKSLTEAEWLVTANPHRLFYWGEQKYTQRKIRLLACACSKLIWHLLPDSRSRTAIDIAEKFADSQVKRKDMLAAHQAAVKIKPKLRQDEHPAEYAAGAISRPDRVIGRFVIALIEEALTQAKKDRVVAGKQMSALGRDIFGNPFRPITIAPAWQTATVVTLAEAIYDDRAFDRMPILGDALEDAGCDHAAILQHCREPGEHCRGCWVVDLILGKE